MPLAKLEDLKTVLAMARAAGYKQATNPEWPEHRIVSTIKNKAEEFGFDPDDPALEHEIDMAVDKGRSCWVVMETEKGDNRG